METKLHPLSTQVALLSAFVFLVNLRSIHGYGITVSLSNTLLLSCPVLCNGEFLQPRSAGHQTEFPKALRNADTDRPRA